MLNMISDVFTWSFRKASAIRTVARLNAVLVECLRLKKPFGFEFFANALTKILDQPAA